MRSRRGNFEFVADDLESQLPVKLRGMAAGVAPEEVAALPSDLGDAGRHQSATAAGAAHFRQGGHPPELPREFRVWPLGQRGPVDADDARELSCDERAEVERGRVVVAVENGAFPWEAAPEDGPAEGNRFLGGDGSDFAGSHEGRFWERGPSSPFRLGQS